VRELSFQVTQNPVELALPKLDDLTGAHGAMTFFLISFLLRFFFRTLLCAPCPLLTFI